MDKMLFLGGLLSGTSAINNLNHLQGICKRVDIYLGQFAVGADRYYNIKIYKPEDGFSHNEQIWQADIRLADDVDGSIVSISPIQFKANFIISRGTLIKVINNSGNTQQAYVVLDIYPLTDKTLLKEV